MHDATTLTLVALAALLCAWGARRDLRLPIAVTLGGFALAALSVSAVAGIAFAPIAALVLVCLFIAETDRRHHLIPDPMTLALLALALAMPFDDGALVQAFGGLCLGALFLTIRQICNSWRGGDTLGLGDVKLAGAMGAVLGPTHGFIAVAIAGMATIAVVAVRSRGEAAVAGAPFGIGLAAATAAVALIRVLSP
jgi:prepilin signal peptidase PulO-like enzyme (type II secretory pathway)